jgi:hypothetical protein
MGDFARAGGRAGLGTIVVAGWLGGFRTVYWEVGCGRNGDFIARACW